MRWLLDQGLPQTTASLLKEAGHDAVHVGVINLAAAPDPQILAKAVALDRIIVTLDADFHDLLARSGSPEPSVLRIRKEGMKAPEMSRLILAIAKTFRKTLEEGCVMTYRNRQIRFRKLPLS